MFLIATAVMLLFGLILAWDLAGQPTKFRHLRRLLGLKSRRRRYGQRREPTGTAAPSIRDERTSRPD